MRNYRGFPIQNITFEGKKSFYDIYKVFLGRGELGYVFDTPPPLELLAFGKL